MKSRADWMKSGKFGLMVHWLAPGPAPEKGRQIKDFNKAVSRFDVDRFIGDFEKTKADWLIFTIGQNGGFYAGPNPVLDRLAGKGHCSQRDLLLEIAVRVKALGKRFIAYLPCEVNAQSAEIKKAFGWVSKENTAQREFQKRYTEFIGEYSLRLGRLLDGWWYDGAYTWKVFRNSFIRPNLYLGASRAGNADAAAAFNDGSFCVGNCKPVVKGQDYLSGETEVLMSGKVRLGREDNSKLLTPKFHTQRPPASCLWHALVPIDCMWAHGNGFFDWQKSPYKIVLPGRGKMEPPLYTTADLKTLVGDFKSVGGGVTFNVGIFQEGGLGNKTINQLSKLGSQIQQCRGK